MSKNNTKILLADASSAMVRARSYSSPVIEALDLLGIKRSNIALVLGVSCATITGWGAGRSPIPDDHYDALRNLASHALLIAIQVHTKAAARNDHPSQIIDAISVYKDRIHRAEEILKVCDATG